MMDFLNLILEPLQEVFLKVQGVFAQPSGHAGDHGAGHRCGQAHQNHTDEDP